MDNSSEQGSVILSHQGYCAEILFKAVKSRNTLSKQFLADFHHCLDQLETLPEVTLVTLESELDEFCAGMDFEEYVQVQQSGQTNSTPDEFMRLLLRLSSIDKQVVACVRGPVMAGGIGIVAAADLVVCERNSTFSLPEIIWGLIPSIVLPFLIRRCGFQTAYRMTISGMTVEAKQALDYQLVDILCDSLNDELRKLKIRAQRLYPQAIKEVKDYFKQLLHVKETQQNMAVNHLHQIMNKPRVQNNIHNYVNHKVFPWQSVPETLDKLYNR